MGKLDGKVALVTGAGHGQGRSHAVVMAEEGADIIAIDICEEIASMDYPLATEEELKETEKMVSDLGRGVITAKADVRYREAVQAVVDKGVKEFGHLDIVAANAGMCILGKWDEVTDQDWQDQIDVNLTGMWNTMRSTIPALIDNGGGSIICTSSTGGVKGSPFFSPYVAAKWGLRGLVRVLANELGKHSIRINTVIPTGVDTNLVKGVAEGMERLIEEDPDLGPLFMNTLPVELLQPRDISMAVLWLASDDSKYTTGLDLKVDAGCTIR
jgi:SDR family mycofactocin-dependent oxidoreductase